MLHERTCGGIPRLKHPKPASVNDLPNQTAMSARTDLPVWAIFVAHRRPDSIRRLALPNYTRCFATCRNVPQIRLPQPTESVRVSKPEISPRNDAAAPCGIRVLESASWAVDDMAFPHKTRSECAALVSFELPYAVDHAAFAELTSSLEQRNFVTYSRSECKGKTWLDMPSVAAGQRI
jgi:hypothetical protein